MSLIKNIINYKLILHCTKTIEVLNVTLAEHLKLHCSSLVSYDIMFYNLTCVQELICWESIMHCCFAVFILASLIKIKYKG
jgi:hypothetical protein